MLSYLILALQCLPAWAADFVAVRPAVPLVFPQDHGAHPAYRTEWWYVTGWLTLPGGKLAGFQVTFFRSATGIAPANPSRFSPTQLLIAHAALSDPAVGHLLHDQKAARAGFGLAEAARADTDLRLDDWTLRRLPDGRYRTTVATPAFRLDFMLTPGAPRLLQGEGGYSRKGPVPTQASYYYSEPQLKVSGTLIRGSKPQAVTGLAWLDHEWSSEYLDPQAVGWDWVGLNLNDGGALMAFRMRDAKGGTRWAGGTIRGPDGQVRVLTLGEVKFSPHRHWQSPHTQTRYPVEMALSVGSAPADTWRLVPLMDDQELDARASTGGVYWEGAVVARRGGKPAGRGYLELTGYGGRLRM